MSSKCPAHHNNTGWITLSQLKENSYKCLLVSSKVFHPLNGQDITLCWTNTSFTRCAEQIKRSSWKQIFRNTLGVPYTMLTLHNGYFFLQNLRFNRQSNGGIKVVKSLLTIFLFIKAAVPMNTAQWTIILVWRIPVTGSFPLTKASRWLTKYSCTVQSARLDSIPGGTWTD